jgi:DNA-directed RNA polymerase specialized sigma24 family protein
VLRHYPVAGKMLPELAPGLPAVDPVTFIGLEHSVLISALRALAPREREVLVLLYYAGLPEAQAASAMRISKDAVKSHAAAAMSALRAELGNVTS